MNKKDEPFVISTSELPVADSDSPADAPPPPEDMPGGEAMQPATRLAAHKPSRWAAWFWTAAGSLLSLIISVATYDYITSLLARFPALGIAALVLTGILALIILVQVFRELIAIRRLSRINKFRTEAGAARASHNRKAAVALSKSLEDFYSGRSDIAWGARGLEEQRGDLLDADAVIDLTERSLFTSLDAQARTEIESASRSVAGATALIPLAMVDVLAALSLNIRMIRRIAEIYGARGGLFGSWRLLRSVATHLLATGLVAVGDDMLSSVAGGGALSKISRKFGEGVVNGALTARVGIAAMEVCRPLPFSELPRPKVSNIVSRALTGMFPKKAD